MVELNESINTFKRKFLKQGISLTNRFNSLIGESVSSVHYTRNYEGEDPLIIEDDKCHHVPYNGLTISFQSGRRILIFDSNIFSESGGTFGIDMRDLMVDEIIGSQIEHTFNPNWSDVIDTKLKSIKVIWIDDDGWESPKEVDGQIIMVLDKKSQGIFPHGIELIFERDEPIYILAVEPDNYYETEKRYKYLRGGEEFVIAFNRQVAEKQKLIIEGIQLEIK